MPNPSSPHADNGARSPDWRAPEIIDFGLADATANTSFGPGYDGSAFPTNAPS